MLTPVAEAVPIHGTPIPAANLRPARSFAAVKTRYTGMESVALPGRSWGTVAWAGREVVAGAARYAERRTQTRGLLNRR